MANKVWPVVCVIAMAAADGLSDANAAKRVFILEISQRGLLCGYTSETEWAKVPKEKDVEVTAVVSSTNSVLASVLVERFTEDTATYDEYSVDKSGDIRRLKRTLDVVPDRVTREQIWNISGGRPVKVSESWMQFKTHKPIPPDKDIGDLAEGPIILRVSDFPFRFLIADKHPELWTGGKRCVSGRMNSLEALPRK